MAFPVELEETLAGKFASVLPHLDERQRRLVLGAEARALGHGGIKLVARAAGVASATVSKGVAELEEGGQPLGRARRPGGGRKRVTQTDPGVLKALLELVEPSSRGDPQSPLRWTTKATRKLAEELTKLGHRVSAWTVGNLLREENFSLQATSKQIEGRQHADRDAQFRYINEQAKAHIEAGWPVVSVDTKKKELVGEYKNGGREWQPKGEPVRVKVHDFIDKQLGKAIPYGVYDLGHNAGWVSVGVDHDTAEFAVATIRRWWYSMGRPAYRQAKRLLITADAGGSNGPRLHLWKLELQKLAEEIGLPISVSHFPPGTSKWNKIEHRLFSFISQNWRGKPLISHQVIVKLIAGTRTTTGLKVRAALDRNTYAAGLKVDKQAIANIRMKPARFHGDWNYSILPAASQSDAVIS